MSRFSQQERAALCDTLAALGPDAATLLPGWHARDLAAHLVVRERRPDAALGMFVPSLAARLESVQSSIAGQRWDNLVDTIRTGPPWWNPMALAPLDEAINLAEFLVHHEDVLRAQPDFTPRVVSAELSQAIWELLPRTATMALRGMRVGVVAESDGFGRRTIHRPKDGHGNVVLRGAPVELLLRVFGRTAVARVQLDGADADVQAFESADCGY